MVEKIEYYIPYLHCYRKIHIYIPDTKKTDTFPVLYMFDGHNLFFDEDATYGKSWGLKDYLEEHDIPLLVVGIECSHEGRNRLNEFSPYSFSSPSLGNINGSGKQFFDWIVNDLKPFIDQKYPTKPEQKYTYIGGSSMGGLMAVYGGCMHDETFSKAICVSTAYSNGFDQLKRDIKNHKKYKNSKFYFSFGEYEAMDKDYFAIMTRKNCECANLLQSKGAFTHINCVLQGTHSEASWEKEIPVFMKVLDIE